MFFFNAIWITGKILTAKIGIVSKLQYENGEIIIFIGDSEFIALSTKLTYANGALEASNVIKFLNSDLVLLNSKLDISNLVFMAEVCFCLKYKFQQLFFFAFFI